MQKDAVLAMLRGCARAMAGAVLKSRTPHRGSPFCGILILLMACLFPIPGDGMMLKMDNTELVARADAVIYGTVEEIRANNHVLEAIIRIHTVLKGNVTAHERLRVSFSPSLADSPTFVTMERVLLFLKEVESGTFQTVGGFQGKLSLN